MALIKRVTVFLLLALAVTQAHAQSGPNGGPSGPSGSGSASGGGIGGATANTVGSDGVLNVKNYGVLGNGKDFYDGAMTNGSSTLTTKQPITSAAQSGTTVTLTMTGFVPVGSWPPYPSWGPGSTIVVSGVSVPGYNGTFTITALTTTTVSYVTTAGLGAATGGTAYVSSPFVIADVGKNICVAQTNNTGGQSCGTITAYIDPQDVTVSFTCTFAFSTNDEFIYGTSDQTAIANIFSNTTLPNGGMIFFPPGIYILTSQITIPNAGSWNIVGAAGGESYSQYGTGNFYLGRPVAMLDWLTTSAPSGAAAIRMSCDGTTSCTGGSGNFSIQQNTIRDLGIRGGAGVGQDGGGTGPMHGIAGYGANGLFIERVSVQNFSGDCIVENSTWQQMVIMASNMFLCAGWGIDVISTQGSNLISNTIQSHNGINMGTGTTSRGVNVLGNTIQAIPGTTIQLGVGLVAGNYMESDSGAPYDNSQLRAVGATLLSNYNVNPWTLPTYQASGGQALPACNSTNRIDHMSAVVSDSTECTNGTTYTGGGAIQCVVNCNGAAWIETGAGAY
jgi:hypothetical protein